MLAWVSGSNRSERKWRCTGKKGGAELRLISCLKHLIRSLCSLIVLLAWSMTTVTLDGLDPSAAAALSQQSCFLSARWTGFKLELKNLTEGLLEQPWFRNPEISQNVWVHWPRLGPVCRQPPESCRMLMWLFRFDHKDWILRDHFSQGLLLHLPAFIYSKIHLDFLFLTTPVLVISLYDSKYALRLECM